MQRTSARKQNLTFISALCMYVQCTMYSVHFTVLWIVKLLCQNFLYEKNIDFITVDKNFIYFLFSENYKRYLKHILKVFLILHFEHFQIFLEILLM